MKLSELEQMAREKQAEQVTQAAKLEAEEAETEAQLTEEFRQKVIAWMVEAGDLDTNELQDVLEVTDRRCRRIKLNVPEHTAITFQISIEDGKIVGPRDDRVRYVMSYGNDSGLCYSLSDALVFAAEQYQEREEQQEHDAAWEAEREERHKKEKVKAAERGDKYLAWLDEYPILRPVLDILGTFLEDRERFNHDLEMAEELAAGVETRLSEKLEQARYDVDRYARERDDLQHDLWNEQEKVRKAEQRCRHR